MIGVQVSSNQVTDNLCFVKGVKGKYLSAHPNKLLTEELAPKPNGKNLEGKETY